MAQNVLNPQVQRSTLQNALLGTGDSMLAPALSDLSWNIWHGGPTVLIFHHPKLKKDVDNQRELETFPESPIFIYF